MNNIEIIDSTLRDGNHTIDNKFNLENISRICASLDNAGVDFIEVGYGYGLSSFQKEGYPSDAEIIETALNSVSRSNICLLVFPDKCELKALNEVAKLGIKYIRIATQASNFRPGAKYIKRANDLGMSAGAFLMMAHRVSAKELYNQSKIAVESGARSICVTDSAGAMTPNEVSEKISLLSNKLNIPIGFHTHDSMGLAIGNSICAIESGATQIDTALNGLGAGAGNAPTESLIAALNKMNINTNSKLFELLDASRILSKIVDEYGVVINLKEDSLIVGYTGVYSTFVKTAKELSKKYRISYRELLDIAAKENLIAGEEYKLEQIANSLMV